MSRKHFEALAKEIREEYINSECEPAARDAICALAGRIARVCADHNPNFDDRRFLTACGIGSPSRVS